MKAIILIFITLISFSTEAKEKTQIIFYELKPISNFDAGKAKVLENLMLGELYNYKELEFLSREDVKKIVDDKEFDKMMECDSKTCILEISGAMGIDYLMNGEIGNVGTKNSILNLQILDSINGKVLSRVYARINNLSEDETINAVIKSTQSLIEDFSSKTNKNITLSAEKPQKRSIQLETKKRDKDNALVLDFSKNSQNQSKVNSKSDEGFWNTSNILILTTTTILAGVFAYGLMTPDPPKKPGNFPHSFIKDDGTKYNNNVEDYNTELDQKHMMQALGGVGMGIGLGTLIWINF